MYLSSSLYFAIASVMWTIKLGIPGSETTESENPDLYPGSMYAYLESAS